MLSSDASATQSPAALAMHLLYRALPRPPSPRCSTLESGTKTRDVGGSATTTQFLDAIVGRVESESHKAKTGKTSKGKSKAV